MYTVEDDGEIRLWIDAIQLGGLNDGHSAGGLVTLTFRSLNSFMRLFVQMPRGFCHLTTSAFGAGYRTY
jgi:hypothetical protein